MILPEGNKDYDMNEDRDKIGDHLAEEIYDLDLDNDDDNVYPDMYPAEAIARLKVLDVSFRVVLMYEKFW
jgi:hypothetical protein